VSASRKIKRMNGGLLTNRINRQWTTPLPVGCSRQNPFALTCLLFPQLYLCWLFCLRTRCMPSDEKSKMTIHSGLDHNEEVKKLISTDVVQQPFRINTSLQEDAGNNSRSARLITKTRICLQQDGMCDWNESIGNIARCFFFINNIYRKDCGLTTGDVEHLQANYNI
jgi:hypothetical protein